MEIKNNLIKNKYIILSGLVIFSLFFHLTGCFSLYDFGPDEGFWLINAKNYVSFNKFYVGADYNMVLSPLNTFLHIPFFRLFGPSIWVGRFISISFAVSTLILFFLFLNKYYGLMTATFSSYIIIVNGILNRTTTFAYLESKIHFFMILSLMFWFSDRRWLKNLSILTISFMLGFKPNSVFFIIPFIYDRLSFQISGGRYRFEYFKKSIMDILLFLAGVLIITTVIYYITYSIEPNVFFSSIDIQLKRVLSMDYVFSLFNNPFNSGMLNSFFHIFKYTPVITILSFIGIVFTLNSNKISRIDKFLLCWIFAEICFYIFQRGVFTRYILNLIFPASVFIGRLFTYLIDKTRFPQRRYLGLSRGLVIMLIITIGLINFIGSFYYFIILKPDRYTIDASRYLEKIQQRNNYKAILSSPTLTLPLSVETYSLYYHEVQDYLKNRELKFPLLCVVEKKAEELQSDDEYLFLLKINARLLKIIGDFRFYEISTNNFNSK